MKFWSNITKAFLKKKSADVPLVYPIMSSQLKSAKKPLFAMKSNIWIRYLLTAWSYNSNLWYQSSWENFQWRLWLKSKKSAIVAITSDYFSNREKRWWNRKFLRQNQKHKRWCQRWIFKTSNFFPVSDNLNFSLPCFSLSPLTTAEVEDFVSESPEAFTPVSLRINPYSEVGPHKTILAMKAFCLRNNLSDRSASDLHSLFDAFLSENCFPSKFAFFKDLKRSFQMNATSVLCRLVLISLKLIEEIGKQWLCTRVSATLNLKLDFSLNKVPPIDLVQPLIINLVLSTDGFQMGLRFRF